MENFLNLWVRERERFQISVFICLFAEIKRKRFFFLERSGGRVYERQIMCEDLISRRWSRNTLAYTTDYTLHDFPCQIIIIF